MKTTQRNKSPAHGAGGEFRQRGGGGNQRAHRPRRAAAACRRSPERKWGRGRRSYWDAISRTLHRMVIDLSRKGLGRSLLIRAAVAGPPAARTVINQFHRMNAADLPAIRKVEETARGSMVLPFRHGRADHQFFGPDRLGVGDLGIRVGCGLRRRLGVWIARKRGCGRGAKITGPSWAAGCKPGLSSLYFNEVATFPAKLAKALDCAR